MANHSRRWRASLENETRLEQPSTSEIFGWILAGAALVTLVAGLACLAYVAVNVPQKSPTTATAASPATPASLPRR
jgi:hypothetical protein